MACFLLAGLLFPTTSQGCDYTVRDIGFVELGQREYSIMVVGPQAAEFTPEQQQPLNDWDLNLVTLSNKSEANLPPEIIESLQRKKRIWSIWLVDGSRRSLRLASAATWEELPSLEAVINKMLNTPRSQEIARESLRSFAQIVLVDVETHSKSREAAATLKSLEKLEPMLPRPISQPARIIVISRLERFREKALIWALGIDNLGLTEPAMAILYGRGRLAGPTLRGDDIKLENTVGQLALVGESCECETDRSWLEERSLPLRWDAELDRQAAQTLGFDPANPQVIAEVKKVIARGRNNNRSNSAGDQIERIVASYFESQVESDEPKFLRVPPGSRVREGVNATVLSGAGWDFDSPEQAEDVLRAAREAYAISEGGTDDAGDGAANGQTTNSRWWWLGLALGVISIGGVAAFLRFAR